MNKEFTWLSHEQNNLIFKTGIFPVCKCSQWVTLLSVYFRVKEHVILLCGSLLLNLSKYSRILISTLRCNEFHSVCCRLSVGGTAYSIWNLCSVQISYGTQPSFDFNWSFVSPRAEVETCFAKDKLPSEKCLLWFFSLKSLDSELQYVQSPCPHAEHWTMSSFGTTCSFAALC